MKSAHSSRGIEFGMCAGLVVATVLMYRKALRLWWTFDDAYLLHTAIERRVLQYFNDGSVWRAMPNRLFTPLLQASYDAELNWFGLVPQRFYVVHLCELALVALAIYAALRLWVAPVAAFCGAFLVLSGAPIASAAAELMVMHYLQAIILAALAVILHVRCFRSNKKAEGRSQKAEVGSRKEQLSRRDLSISPATPTQRVCQVSGAETSAFCLLPSGFWFLVYSNVLSALLYLGAMLAKEIAVPLPAFLFLLSEGSFRQRLRRTAPHWVALAVYVIWRRAMLGEFFGGYGWTVTGAEVPRLLYTLPSKLAAALRGPDAVAGWLLLMAIAASMVAGLRGRRALMLAGSGIVLAVLPIIPISKEMQPRFALASWIVLACLAVIAASRAGTRTSRLLLAALIVTGLAVQRTAWPDELRRAQRMSDEGRFYFDEMGSGSLLRATSVPPAAMGELRWLKEEYVKRPAGAAWFADDWYACTHDLSAMTVWQYSEAFHQFQRRSPAETSRACRSVRTVPLTAEFHHRGDALFWRLGPYRDGRYRFLLADGVQAFDVPAEDGFRFGDLAGLTLRIRYQSPAGWVTYSDAIALDFRGHPDFTWKR